MFRNFHKHKSCNVINGVFTKRGWGYTYTMTFLLMESSVTRLGNFK